LYNVYLYDLIYGIHQVYWRKDLKTKIYRCMKKLNFFFVWIALIECKNELKFLKHYKTLLFPCLILDRMKKRLC
jgi:hypothetical protein